MMKKLKFRGFKAQWILEGTKTATIRLFDDKDLIVGDRLELINSDTSEIFAHAEVAEVIEKNLGELNDTDFEGHEKWNSEGAMYTSLKKYYGDRVAPTTSVKIIRFKLIS